MSFTLAWTQTMHQGSMQHKQCYHATSQARSDVLRIWASRVPGIWLCEIDTMKDETWATGIEIVFVICEPLEAA